MGKEGTLVQDILNVTKHVCHKCTFSATNRGGGVACWVVECTKARPIAALHTIGLARNPGSNSGGTKALGNFLGSFLFYSPIKMFALHDKKKNTRFSYELLNSA